MRKWEEVMSKHEGSLSPFWTMRKFRIYLSRDRYSLGLMAEGGRVIFNVDLVGDGQHGIC